MVLVTLVGTLLSLAWNPKDFWFLCPVGTVAGPGGDANCGRVDYFWVTFGGYILLIYLFIPTTLIVSLPFIQLGQCGFMIQDADMYDESVDECCHIGNPRLTDELGQISHIFSDKTGTLTAHHMAFCRFFFGGTTYGCGDTAISRALRGPQSSPVIRRPPAHAVTKAAAATFVDFHEAEGEPSIFDVLAGGDARSKAAAHEFFLAMALNHSVVLETVDGEIELAASSPDEQAFVAAAEYFGFEFLSRDTFAGIVALKQRNSGVTHEVKLVEVFPYEPSTKRMSVVVELPPALLELVGGGSAFRLYLKGADSAVAELMAPSSSEHEREERDHMESVLYEWGEIALRTLVWGKRDVSGYDEWARTYAAAKASPQEQLKVKQGLPSRITELQTQMETGLTLLGATGIEDKLQDGVPEILHDLGTAGIKVWMLTGDKVGTGMNIARACNILPKGADIIELTADKYPALASLKLADMVDRQADLQNTVDGAKLGRDHLHRAVMRTIDSGRIQAGLPPLMAPSKRTPTKAEAEYEAKVAGHVVELDARCPGLAEVRDALAQHLKHVVRRSCAEDRPLRVASTTRDGGAPNSAADPASEIRTRPLCLVLDEKAIEYFATLLKPMLAAVSNACHSVVACRARKDQKAQMLTMIREGFPGSCTLGIGDGANDVAMLRAAHVGVGIIGKEGRDAVNASDFGIGQFRFLRSLLFVHGRNNYRRLGMFIYFTFYKNMVNSLTMFYFSMVAAASAPLLWPPIISDFLAPAAFTMLPILMFPLFDMDVPKHVAASSPELYTAGIQRVHYTSMVLAGWITEAFFAGAVCSFIVFYGLRNLYYESVSTNSFALATLWTCSFTVYARLIPELGGWSKVEIIALATMLFLLLMMTPVMAVLNGPVPFNINIGFSWFDFFGLSFLASNLGDATWWLMLFLAVIVAILPKMIAHSYVAIKRGKHQHLAFTKRDVVKPITGSVHDGADVVSISVSPDDVNLSEESRDQGGASFTEVSRRYQVGITVDEFSSRVILSKPEKGNHVESGIFNVTPAVVAPGSPRNQSAEQIRPESIRRQTEN